MSNPSLVLRGGPSGPTFAPSTPGYVLAIQADGKSVKPVPAGGGGGGLVLENVLWVTPGASGENLFGTIQDAIDSVLDKTPTIIMCAPVEYDEALIVPEGRILSIECVGGGNGVFAHLPINDAIAWEVGDDDQLCLTGFNALGGVLCSDGAGSGSALLQLNRGNYGDVDASINHAVGVVGYGAVRGGSNVLTGQLDLTVNDITTANGITLENALVLGDLATTAGNITLRNPLLGAARDISTPNDVFIYGCQCVAPQDLTDAANLWLDEVSYQQLIGNARLTNTAAAVVHWQSPLGQYLDQASGASIQIDFGRAFKQKIDLTANCVAEIVPPPSFPATLTLEVQQIASFTLGFTSDVTLTTPGGNAEDAAMLTGAGDRAIYVFDWNGSDLKWQSTTAQGSFAV